MSMLQLDELRTKQLTIQQRLLQNFQERDFLIAANNFLVGLIDELDKKEMEQKLKEDQ